MARRRKYYKALTEYEVADFVREATQMHHIVINWRMPLSFNCEHHQALYRLHEASPPSERSRARSRRGELHANHMRYLGWQG